MVYIFTNIDMGGDNNSMYKTSMNLPEDLMRELKHIAIDERTNVRALVTMCMRAYVEERKKEKRE